MSVPGQMHTFVGTPCQDHTAFYREGAVAASVLADGAGSLAHASEGAQETAHTVAVWLVRHFRQLLCMTDAGVREGLSSVICARLKALGARMGAQFADFGSTLLAVCAEAGSGAYLAVHLGDGVICARGADGAVRPLTLADRGENSQCATYLTTLLTSREMREHIRVCRGTLDDAFVLMSDGGENSMYAQGGRLLSPSLGLLIDRAASAPVRFDAELRETVNEVIRPMDDLSIVILVNQVLRSVASVGYDEARRNLSARRVARSRLLYAQSRDAGSSIEQAVRAAGWHRRERRRRIDTMRQLGIETALPLKRLKSPGI